MPRPSQESAENRKILQFLRTLDLRLTLLEAARDTGGRFTGGSAIPPAAARAVYSPQAQIRSGGAKRELLKRLLLARLRTK